LVLVEMSDQYS